MTRILKRTAGLAAFFGLWQLLSLAGVIAESHLPPLQSIGAAFARLASDVDFAKHFTLTLSRMAVGFAVAVALALLTALLTGRYRWLRRMLEPTVDILRSMPPPALVPMMILILGLGAPLFYFVVVFGAMWPTYISASNALSVAEPVQVNAARSFGYSDWEIMWRVRVPAALPEAFSGIRLSAGIALLATVATEMLVGGDGLGYLIFNAGFSMLMPDMYALMFLIGATGIVVNAMVAGARRMVSGWSLRLAAMGSQT
jgi:NitT/TauT family transport system permease protein